MAADGSLNFDTGLETKGFVKGIKEIGKKFIGSAANIKAAFDMVLGSVNSVISSCNNLMSVYQTQIEAEARLGATMRNSTSATNAQIQSVKDLASELQELGVVGDEVQLAGAQELATYVSSVDSIKTMLPVLDDMIAQQYGFSASTDSAVTIATMLGKVLQGQTSALSRYGYSFDEAQEKLLKYGTEEERVATLAAVVSESVGGVNAALADTPTGKVKQLSNDFGDLKETMGKLVTEIVYPLVKQLDIIVKKLNNIFTTASNGLKNLLGIKDGSDTGSAIVGMTDEAENNVEDIIDSAKDNIESSLDDAEKAVKKTQNNLASFDKLNVMQSNDEDEQNKTELPVTADEVAEVSNEVNLLENSLNSVDSTVFDTLFDKIKRVLNVLEPLVTAVKRNVQAAVEIAQKGIEKYLNKYGDKISEYSDKIKNHLENTAMHTANGITNILNEAAASQERYSEELSTGYADLLGGASIFGLSFEYVFSDMLDITSKNFEDWTTENKEVIGGFFDDCNKNASNSMSTFGSILESIGTTLTDWWDNTGAAVFDKLTAAFFDIKTALLELWSAFVQPIIESAIENIQKLWDEHLQPLWENLLYLFSSVGDLLAALWNNVLRPVVDWIIKKLAPGISVITTTIVDVVTDCIGWIIDLISSIVKILQGVIDFLTGIFSGDIEKVFEAVETMAEGLATAIINTVKFMINVIVDALNLLWGAIYTAVKGIVDTIGDITGALGDLLGKNWRFSMPDEPPKIPRLATGTVVPASYGEFAAILGDNKREPEVVSPLSTIKQAMIEALTEVGYSGGNDGDIVIQIGNREVFRAVKEEAEHWSRSHGGKPAFG